ncbi:glycosyltransferase [Variovorax ginsengisoli]|uniref:Glycosyltransferase n=1 Tax=Variovorax ginsengisoli TaxID=363844 RepID=A0ABT8SEG8_9BURK|nr:glycosyltransferase [Variovorax ginsengisoli]MDN8617549.1 glycosyltransferase [Variovorax ginsengisoli]MDO1536719.1 glycosyltransferase [Variovorax ginsengisoli]
MARIAYLDHSFHRTTRSTAFLPEILRRHGHSVDLFWDDAWQGGPPVAWADVRLHDVVIMFQSYCAPDRPQFRQSHPNIVYVPMLDQFGLWQGPVYNLSAFWEPFQGSKVLNFSNAVHCMTSGFGIVSHFVRYYQPVIARPAPARQGLHGFFWLRREPELPWRVIRRLIGNTAFDSFHIHLAVDPGTPAPEDPSAEDIARHHITTSTWFENKADLDAVMERANVFFAPRLEEGIGQSFLEAMGRGQCVVAPNHGTMNEYIIPGLNGLLYEARDPQPLDFSTVEKLGSQARDGVVAGRAAWENAEADLVRFILTRSEALYAGKYQHALGEAEVGASTAPASGAPPRASASFGLRGFAQRHAIFRSTRFIWHPMLRLARQLLGR